MVEFPTRGDPRRRRRVARDIRGVRVFELEDPPAPPFEFARGGSGRRGRGADGRRRAPRRGALAELEDPPAPPFESAPEEAPVAEAEERTADVVHLDAELLAEVGEAVAVAVVPPEPETEPAPEPQAAVEDGDAADDAHQAVEESELGEVIHRALSLGATSVQLAPQARGVVVRARIDGAMHELATLQRPAGDEAVRRLAARAGLDADARNAAEGLFPFDHGDRVWTSGSAVSPRGSACSSTSACRRRRGGRRRSPSSGSRDVDESLRQAFAGRTGSSSCPVPP